MLLRTKTVNSGFSVVLTTRHIVGTWCTVNTLVMVLYSLQVMILTPQMAFKAPFEILTPTYISYHILQHPSTHILAYLQYILAPLLVLELFSLLSATPISLISSFTG